MLTLFPQAKINLTLEVLRRRSDGYHDIISIMQTIDLVDALALEPSDQIHFLCDDASLAGAGNLVMKAAQLLQERTGCKKGARIELTKHIPRAAGLGGGSSDAAAALRGLERLWGLELPWETLQELAVELGSDVAFFLHGGTALVEGRGEKVTPLPPPPRRWLVVLKPPPSLEKKTALLYGSLTAADFSQGEPTRRLMERLLRGEGAPSSLLYNVFERAAHQVFPHLEAYYGLFQAAGAASIHLAGSGPSLFAFMRDRDEAEGVFRRLQGQGLEAYLAQTT